MKIYDNKKDITFLPIFFSLLWVECIVPKRIKPLLVKKQMNTTNNYRRNARNLKSLCVHQIEFKEGKYLWKMLLVTHPSISKCPFWFSAV